MPLERSGEDQPVFEAQVAGQAPQYAFRVSQKLTVVPDVVCEPIQCPETVA